MKKCQKITILINLWFLINIGKTTFIKGGQWIIDVDKKITKPCPLGHYCQNGIKYPCPAGTYGTDQALEEPQCSGFCPKGYYCPEGTLLGPDDLLVFCLFKLNELSAAGSKQPSVVDPAYYVVNHFKQQICDKGHFCQHGKVIPCPAGSYAPYEGTIFPPRHTLEEFKESSYSSEINKIVKNNTLTPTMAIGKVIKVFQNNAFYDHGLVGHVFTLRTVLNQCFIASPGYYSPLCSSEQVTCPSTAVYCERGSPKPVKVQDGYFTVSSSDRFNPATTKVCSTDKVFSQSINTENVWKAYDFLPKTWETTRPNHSCYVVEFTFLSQTVSSWFFRSPLILTSTKGRSAQLPCPKGHFCPINTGLIFKCPPGFYGDREQEIYKFCSGKCPPGYICPAGTTHQYRNIVGMGAITNEFGGILRCFRNSRHEIEAKVSVETIEFTLSTFLKSKHQLSNVLHGRTFFAPLASPAPFKATPGYYTKVEKNSVSVEGMSFFLENNLALDEWSTVKQLFPAVDNVLSMLHSLVPLGPLEVLDTRVIFCQNCVLPPFLGVYVMFLIKFYIILHGSTQDLCPVGHYCINGLKTKCLEGFYGATKGLFQPTCSGICPAGYWCPTGTSFQYERVCSNASVYCPAGVAREIQVPEGYYSLGSKLKEFLYSAKIDSDVNSFILGSCSPSLTSPVCALSDFLNSTLKSLSYDQLLSLQQKNLSRSKIKMCEIGYYCQNGVKYMCPEGVFGAVSGLSSSKCSGLCSAGYFCPPRSTNPNQHSCGSILTEKSFYKNRFNLFCILFSLPYHPKLFVEFSLLDFTYSEQEEPQLWNLAEKFLVRLSEEEKSKIGWEIEATTGSNIVNNLTEFQPKEIAWKSSSLPGSYLEIVHSQDPDHAFCFWKKFLSTPENYTLGTHFGLDGSYKLAIGRYKDAYEKLFIKTQNYSGVYGKLKSDTNDVFQIEDEKWYLYCGSMKPNSTRVYISNIEEKKMVEVEVELLSNVSTNTTSHDLDFFFNFTSFNVSNEQFAFQDLVGINQERNIFKSQNIFYGVGSHALYGGIYHFEQYLNHRDINKIYETSRGFYPGHGGSRVRDEVDFQCGNFPENEYLHEMVKKAKFKGTSEPLGYSMEIYLNQSAYSEQVVAVDDYREQGDNDLIKYRTPSTSYIRKHKRSKVILPGVLSSEKLVVGGRNYFCPSGSGLPTQVTRGYYSLGSYELKGENIENYQTRQVLCEQAHYCVLGEKKICPAGFYGNISGLFNATCSGHCPANFFCIAGTVNPVPCKNNSFSLPGSIYCETCPEQPLPNICKTYNRCCNSSRESINQLEQLLVYRYIG
eukprot:maker-scaffold_4-snap-gene-14.3-mRNA-1 protein AED:0.17 eAED:0.17 QI:86/0/0/1/0/0/2/0/1312